MKKLIISISRQDYSKKLLTNFLTICLQAIGHETKNQFAFGGDLRPDPEIVATF